jgi:hypothetical protein
VTVQERKVNEKVQGELSGEFIINRDLRQGDVLSADLFILILGKVIKETEVNKGGMIFNRIMQYFAYAHDVKLVARNSQNLEEAFQQLYKASEKAGLKVNEIKTKDMIKTRNKVRF